MELEGEAASQTDCPITTDTFLRKAVIQLTEAWIWYEQAIVRVSVDGQERRLLTWQRLRRLIYLHCEAFVVPLQPKSYGRACHAHPDPAASVQLRRCL